MLLDVQKLKELITSIMLKKKIIIIVTFGQKGMVVAGNLDLYRGMKSTWNDKYTGK